LRARPRRLDDADALLAVRLFVPLSFISSSPGSSAHPNTIADRPARCAQLCRPA
jgi:hypothetical protein